MDIDGVLIRPTWDYEKQAWRCSKPDPTCVNNLNFIIERTEACIVVSSVWRLCGKVKIATTLEEWGVWGETLDITPQLDDQERGEEIALWLSRNEVDKFVILDDDNDMGSLKEYLVQTDPLKGLSKEDSLRAIDLLVG